jgi:hypothetical protein
MRFAESSTLLNAFDDNKVFVDLLQEKKAMAT